jgi:hypothetical protein
MNTKATDFMVPCTSLMLAVALAIAGCGVKPEEPAKSSALSLTVTPPTSPASRDTAIPRNLPVTYGPRCSNPNADLSNDIDSSGILIINDPAKSYGSEIYLKNLATLSTIGLSGPEETLSNFRVSPNARQVAYLAVNKADPNDGGRLVVRNLLQESTIEIPRDPSWGWQGLRAWLSDDWLLISTIGASDSPLIVLNPFTKETEQIPSVFPGQVSDSRGGNLPAIYDPSTQFVIYGRTQGDLYGFSLLNRQENAIMTFFPSQTLKTFALPTWSHNGNKFVLATKPQSDSTYTFKILVGTKDGKVSHLVDLAAQFPSYYVSSFSWSPDDRYISFIVNDVDRLSQTLMLIDLADNEVLETCLDVNYMNWAGLYADINYPIWAPNGRQVIVEQQANFGENRVILLDLPQMTAALLGRNERILGWLSDEP